MSLRQKLFTIFISVSALILVMLFLINRAQFERGFGEVKRQHEWRYTRMLVERAETLYAREQSWWQVQTRPGLWREWMSARAHHRLPRAEHEHMREHQEHRPPPSLMRQPPEQPLWLADANKQWLAGPQPMPEAHRLQWHPLYDDEKLIGYLALSSFDDQVHIAEKHFEQMMLRQLGYSGLAALLLSALLAYGLASWLERRVTALRLGAKILREGDYGYRLDATAADEVGELARDFNALAAHLQQLEQYRDHAFAEWAHELRTPIAVLRAEIEALHGGVRERSDEAFNSLLAEVQHLTQRVDDLTTLSRAHAGGLSLQRQPVDLVELIQDVARLHQQAMVRAQLQWQPQLPEKLIANVDPSRMRQVLHNLFENALRYCPQNTALHLLLSANEKQLTLCWEDNGPGVAENDLPHLFERFYRADVRLANIGSGLGLAIVKAIIEAHGGRVSARRSSLGGLAIGIEIPQ